MLVLVFAERTKFVSHVMLSILRLQTSELLFQKTESVFYRLLFPAM